MTEQTAKHPGIAYVTLQGFAVLVTKSTNTSAMVMLAGQNNFVSNLVELLPLLTDTASTPDVMESNKR